MEITAASRPARILLLVLTLGTLAYALGVVVFGVIDLITQLATGDIRPTMYWSDNIYLFQDDGDGSGVHISGLGGSVGAIVRGISAGTTAIYIASTLVGLLTQFALGALALRMLSRLRAGRPFDRSAWRDVAASSIAVLAVGVVSQLLAWWSRVAVIRESGGDRFSTAFVFDPLTVTVALALAIVAIAFRWGERLQRETEGLV
ncbi:MAG: hypothetical protein M3N46_03580 [Actinomycetota bacterium]|nr:hypothetical protein [Actinomycetota bacterium]